MSATWTADHAPPTSRCIRPTVQHPGVDRQWLTHLAHRRRKAPASRAAFRLRVGRRKITSQLWTSSQPTAVRGVVWLRAGQEEAAAKRWW